MPVSVSSDYPNSPTIDFPSLYEPLLPHLGRLDDFLDNQVESFEPEVQELVRYSLGNSGKRIRSMLLFYSGWNDDDSLDDPFIKAAAVIELVHLATLVHDDILDDAAIRHQRPTISQKYGASMAVLFGDALFAHALKLAAEFPTVEICRSVSLATRRVCAGEIQQNFLKGYANLSLEQYFRIIELKTAELFWLSCRLGAYLAGHESDSLEAVEVFGRHLGIAYQIYDDVADLMGNEAQIGKTLGTDLNHGKFTLPLLLLFQDLPTPDRTALLNRIRKGEAGVEHDLISHFKEKDVIPRTLDFFHDQLQRSTAALDAFPDRASTRKLLAINTYIGQQMSKLSL